MGFSEDVSPIVKGSALCALEETKPELGQNAIEELMRVVDEVIPTPQRDLEVPYLMPIDHVHNILEEANAGDQMGMLARGIKHTDVRRGMCVVKPKSIKQHNNFRAQVYLMTPDEGGRKKPCVADMQLMCFSKTWDCSAFINLVDKEMALPGEDATMDLKLLKPMVLEEGQTFTIRDNSGTIGTGKVSKLHKNMTEEEIELMTMNKAKRAKKLASKA